MSDPSDLLVMFLHGVGANGADLAPLANILLPFLPASVFAAPDGPERFDGGGSGRQWFSVAGVTQANRSERVQHARAAFDRVVSGEIEKHGFARRFRPHPALRLFEVPSWRSTLSRPGVGHCAPLQPLLAGSRLRPRRWGASRLAETSGCGN